MLDRILKTAAGEIGYREGEDNDTKYGIEFGLNNQPWCVMFLWWCFKHSGGGELFPDSAHCDGVRAFAKEKGRWYDHSDIGEAVDIQRGDIIIFDYAPADGSGDHICLVENVTNNCSFQTIEGNYANMVMRVNRTLEDVSGLYRPDYGEDMNVPATEETEEETGDAFMSYGEKSGRVCLLQYALYLIGYAPANSQLYGGGWDGEYGDGTANAVRAVFGRDGKTVSEEEYLKLCKGV